MVKKNPKDSSNTSYPPAGSTTQTMICLYLTVHAQTQIIGSHPAGG